MTYLPGKTYPGGEDRTFSLDYRQIADALGVSVMAGTLNIRIEGEVNLGEPDIVSEDYEFWNCSVSTSEMIERDKAAIPGFIFREKGSDLPDNFIEILSTIHIRTALEKINWPSFPIEVSI